jgi:hypothetical protein
MKNLFLSTCLIFLSYFSFSQDVKYCEIVGTKKFMSNKVLVQIDNGQDPGSMGIGYLKDENGKNKIFNSMVAAMNFMSEHGWKFVQAYAYSDQGQNVYHYLLQKPKSSTAEN